MNQQAATRATQESDAIDHPLPNGVRVQKLARHDDSRGSLAELYRETWCPEAPPVLQYNWVHSKARVLRGVHTHHIHFDQLVVVSGQMLLGLHDLRSDSETAGLSSTIVLTDESFQMVSIPPGVAHGFYYPVPTIHVYGVTDYWDPADEHACHWNDPGLNIEWTDSEPIISERDSTAGTLENARQSYESALRA